jgi:predicted transposase/invertase (TIGR01784 family)
MSVSEAIETGFAVSHTRQFEIMSVQVANIHDAFFKQSLSDPVLAAAFLREHLPPELANLIGPEAPELCPGTFVDEELRQHHSDLLFQVHLKGSRDAFAYILVEHKSTPDPAARLQLLRYIVCILVQWHEREQRLPLPAVLPLLAHQGPKDWEFSCEFMDLFGPVAEEVRPYLPSFHHALVDLARMDDEALSGEARLRAFLKALKYGRRRDLPDCLDIVFAEAPVLTESDLFAIVTYLDKGPITVHHKLMHDVLQRLVPERKERIMGWFSQGYYEEGLAQGRTEGHTEGRTEGLAEGLSEGAAKILLRLLQKRFGAVSDGLRQRIFAADVGSIEAWVERAIDAPDLESIFDLDAAQVAV